MSAHFCILTYSLLPKLLVRFSTAESECYKIMLGLTELGEQLYMLEFTLKRFLFLLSPSFFTPYFCCLFCPTSILTVFIDNVDIPSVLGPEHYWGFWARVEQKNISILQYALGFSCYFHFLFNIFLLFSLIPIFTLKSSSVLFQFLPSSPVPHCLNACSNHCSSVCVANNCRWWIWSCSVIIYENCALSSLLGCFPCDFIWLNTAERLWKSRQEQKGLPAKTAFLKWLCLSAFLRGTGATSFSTACQGLLGLLGETSEATYGENYHLLRYHYAKKKTAGESLMKSLAVLPADSLWTRATDMNHISVLSDRK